MSRILLELGDLYEREGKLDEARRAYELLLVQKLPGGTLAQRRLARFSRRKAPEIRPWRSSAMRGTTSSVPRGPVADARPGGGAAKAGFAFTTRREPAQNTAIHEGSEFRHFCQGRPDDVGAARDGLAGTLIFIERVLYLHRGQIRSTAFVGGIKNILAKRRLMEALTVCEETPGPVAAVVRSALLHADRDEQTMRLAVQEAALIEIPVLERRLNSIAAITQVAPLVGLLGTLLGMITTFHAFVQGGSYATASSLAAGMWQALISTAASLIVAIPGHLAYHFLSGRVRAIVRDVEWSGNEIMKYLLGEYRTPAFERQRRAGSGGETSGKTMITHPLDLASRLRPPPRNHDVLFFLNGALIMMFFVLFGSRFVLAPGLGVDFRLPEMARAGAAPNGGGHQPPAFRHGAGG